MKQDKKVVEAVQEMNSVVGGINLRAGMLDDISAKLYMLMDDMDNAVHKGQEMAYYREHHQEIRILAPLMHYVMKDFLKEAEDIVSIGELLHDSIVKGERHE